MLGCCYSCKYWKDAKIRRAIFDVKREFKGDEEVTIEFGGKKVKIPSWSYHIDESMKKIIEGIKEGSVRYCNDHLIRPWDSYGCFEPRITVKEVDINTWEERESSYLACWTEEGCPFKERCYKEQKDNYYFG
jgi:hypothetical protein